MEIEAVVIGMDVGMEMSRVERDDVNICWEGRLSRKRYVESVVVKKVDEVFVESWV